MSSQLPISGRSRPASTSSSVVLPLPLGPCSSSISPAPSSKSRFSKSSRSPRRDASPVTFSVRGGRAAAAVMTPTPNRDKSALASTKLFLYKPTQIGIFPVEPACPHGPCLVPRAQFGRSATQATGSPVTQSLDSFKSRSTLSVGGRDYVYFSLVAAEKNGLQGISRLPRSMKVVLENLLRFEDGVTVTKADIEAVAAWLNTRSSDHEISYRPARVLMQDFTGVPAVVDLAAMRDATAKLGADPQKINPLVPVDLVIDHSVMVDSFGSPLSFNRNVEAEYERNGERYEFLRWGQKAFDNFRVVPPGTGICHQVNLEYLAQTVWTSEDQNGETVAYPDTLVGTDSHTTMVNGLSVLGWGVGGIEAEAAMLGQPITMLIPEVVGFKMTGRINEGITATDLVLTVTEMLRAKGVVGKFVEFYGPGLDDLSLEDQATIANMAPEYGATCGFFPIDADTLVYLQTSGRTPERV